MAVNIPGIISVAVFYVVILIIGVWAGRKAKKSKGMIQILLANRDMGGILSFFTISATWLGGGFINGTAEKVAKKGLVWTQAPIGYSLSLILCGIFFCPKMRRSSYVTMFDPFQEKYGPRVGALMCIPQFFADLFWSAAILSALGATVHIVLDMEETLSIIISASIAVLYTLLGGLWSVVYTDVIQLVCLSVGLTVASPFIMTHPAVNVTQLEDQDKWLGEVTPSYVGKYIDLWLLLILGGTTWQELYQRALACRTPQQARTSSLLAGVFCLLMSVPPVAIGLAGITADWNTTTYTGDIPIPKDKMRLILPLALQYLCPLTVSIIGLGAISAAVMSSTDSSILVTASVFTKNIYKTLIRPRASDREQLWVMRIAIIVAGAMAATLAIFGKSVYGLFVLCSDLMYVILFPQFVCVLFCDFTNAYGSLFSFVLGFVLRVIAGEPLVELPSLIRYPLYSETDGQLFPFRSFTVAITFVTLYGVSKGTGLLFAKDIVPRKYDFLNVLQNKRRLKIDEATEVEEMMPHGNDKCNIGSKAIEANTNPH